MRKANSKKELSGVYPDLARWKANGFDKFPPFPLQEIIDEVLNSKLLDDESIFWDIQRKAQGNVQEGRQSLVEQVLFRAQENDEKYVLEAVRQMQNAVRLGKDREKEIKRFTEIVVPKRQGGRTFDTELELQILKWYYRSLQSCIKFVRAKLELPLKCVEDHDEPYHEDDIPEAKTKVSGIEAVFEDGELLSLTKCRPIAEIALSIVLHRLKKYDKYHFQISERTLQTLFTQVQPI